MLSGRRSSRDASYLSIAVFLPLAAATSLAQPSGLSIHELAGKWTHSDAQTAIEYTFSEDQTFRAHSVIIAPDYPHFEIQATGIYTRSGDTISITPKSATFNGKPAALIVVTGRYDKATDQLLLKQSTDSSYVSYKRGSLDPPAANVASSRSSTLPGVLFNALGN